MANSLWIWQYPNMGTATVVEMNNPSTRFFRPFREFWPFFLPLLVLLPGLADFPFPGSGAAYSDLAITHFPNAVLLKTAIFEEGILPLWSPHILSGFPFISHPYSGIWYPPYWLSLLLPLPLGLNVLTLVHLVWAGIGMALLLQQNGIGRSAAVFGGLAFEAAPKLFAHIGAGHFMLVLAVCWTPWLLLSARKLKGASRLQKLFQPGVVLAVIFLIDPRWAIYASMLWLAWQLTFDIGLVVQRITTVALQILLAVGLTLPAAWLYLEYALLSTRAALSPADVMQFSIPIGFLPFTLIAQRLPSHEFTLYFGLVVIALALAGLLRRKTTGFNIFWAIVFLVALFISLGDNIPGMTLLANLPGFDQLRVPPRALFLASMAMAALAAAGMQSLVDRERTVVRRSFLALLLVVVLPTVLYWISNFVQWKLSFWATLILALTFAVTELYSAQKISPRFFVPLITGLLLLDLLAFDMTSVRFRPRSEVINQDADTAQYLASQTGRFRVYSPTYSLSQQTAALLGIELASGVDPLQLGSYAAFTQSASGLPPSGYSVSLPSITDDLATVGTENMPDAQLLGLLNVKFVLSATRIESQGLSEVETLGSTHIYENEYARPRAWVEQGDGFYVEAELYEWSYNHIYAQAKGPGLLVLSEISYPGWRVNVDGEPAILQTAHEVLRAIQIDAGEHIVEFEFSPQALRYGLPFPFLTLAALLFWPTRAK